MAVFIVEESSERVTACVVVSSRCRPILIVRVISAAFLSNFNRRYSLSFCLSCSIISLSSVRGSAGDP